MSNANDLGGGAIAGVRSSDALAGPRSGPRKPGVSGGAREAQLRIGGTTCRVCDNTGYYHSKSYSMIMRCPLCVTGRWSETAAAASGPANTKLSNSGHPHTP